MRIFDAEKNAGLEDVLSQAGVVEYVSEASFDESFLAIANEKDLKEKLQKTVEDVTQQTDSGLFPLRSVLVSTGWNKNTDVFSPLETWTARATPIDKPFNHEHNEQDIIGHITH